ncbi:MAG TPA: spore coat protein [Firmicutes bacterium]|nr:spore coat protein [Candidatus Fermentithermobacillaceae bacterium]
MPNQPQEKEWAGILLYLQKLEASMLCTAALEAQSQELRDHYYGLLSRSLQNQKALFDIMKRMGWYSTEPAPQEQAERSKTCFTKMRQQAEQMQSPMQ